VALRLNLALAFLGASVACTYPPAKEEETSKPSSAQPAAPQRVRPVTAVYLDTCAKCHGENGQGGGGGTKSLLTADKFDQKWDRVFFDAIKNGVPNHGMPEYGTTMSDEEIWGQVVHIRELQGKALRDSFAPKESNGVYATQHHNFTVETVVDSGLRTPWGIDWLPDGRMLVTNKPGDVVVVKDGKIVSTIEGTPKSVEIGQGGMLEVAVHPDYAKNGWVYLAYTEPAPGGSGGQTKVVRGKLKFEGDKASWTNQETIFQAPPESYTQAGVHFGTRIAFDGKGNLFFSIGERGGMIAAQDPKTAVGKIYRVKDDGKVPADNPFANQAGAIGAVWSIGHRNPQGLVVDLNGNLWDTEHGPRGGDEVNRIVKGANYGWPTHAFSINYNDAPFKTPWPKEGENITLPVFRWLPSTGACGLDVARGAAFPKWKGDLLAGGLAGQNLDRIRIKDDKVVEREVLVLNMGRVREVAVAKDGVVYLALNGPDKIVKLVPVK
jgi:glucose/arabinose dehydrogenase/cytochrome c5